MAPDDYDVSASAAGFQTQAVNLTMVIGSEQELNFTLRIGAAVILHIFQARRNRPHRATVCCTAGDGSSTPWPSLQKQVA